MINLKYQFIKLNRSSKEFLQISEILQASE